MNTNEVQETTESTKARRWLKKHKYVIASVVSVVVPVLIGGIIRHRLNGGRELGIDYITKRDSIDPSLYPDGSGLQIYYDVDGNFDMLADGEHLGSGTLDMDIGLETFETFDGFTKS